MNSNYHVKGFRFETLYLYNEYPKFNDWSKARWASSLRGRSRNSLASGIKNYSQEIFNDSTKEKLFLSNKNYPLANVPGYDDLFSLFHAIKDYDEYFYLLDIISSFLIDIIKNSSNPYEVRYAIEDLINLYHYKAAKFYYDIMFNHSDVLVRYLFFRKLVSNKFLPYSTISSLRNKWFIYRKDEIKEKIINTSPKKYYYKKLDEHLSENITTGEHLIIEEQHEKFYRLYIPSNIEKSPYPLIVAIHGTFAGDSADLEYFEFLSQINNDNFVLLSPDIKACYLLSEDPMDDVNSIISIIKQLRDYGIIDNRMVAFYGFSCGKKIAKMLFDTYSGISDHSDSDLIETSSGGYNYLGLYTNKKMNNKEAFYYKHTAHV